jgi:hypothetical protein
MNVEPEPRVNTSTRTSIDHVHERAVHRPGREPLNLRCLLSHVYACVIRGKRFRVLDSNTTIQAPLGMLGSIFE